MWSDSAEDSAAKGEASLPHPRPSTDDLIVRHYEADDEVAVLDLLRAALGESETRRRTPAAWRWKHFENPFGTSLLLVVCTPRNEVVALRAFMRWGLTVAGDDLEVVQAVDTAVAREYRRIGLFSRLTERAQEEVRGRTALVFNTPNQYARPAYLRLGWQDVGSLPLMACMPKPMRSIWGRIRRAVRPSRSGGEGRGAESQSDTSICSLLDQPGLSLLLAQHCRQVDLHEGLQTRRSVEYLRWRYGQHPHVRYRAVWIESGQELAACLIYREGTRLGADEVLISEMFLARDDERLATELLDIFLHKVDADYILASFPRHPVVKRALGAAGFRSLPPMLLEVLFERCFSGRQKPRRLLVRPLAPAAGVDVLCLENWHLTVGDLELF